MDEKLKIIAVVRSSYMRNVNWLFYTKNGNILLAILFIIYLA